MASLPCRLCGIDTHVSIGYNGTFVKCLHCRSLSRPGRDKPPRAGPGLDTEEGMRALVDSILADDDNGEKPAPRPRPAAR